MAITLIRTLIIYFSLLLAMRLLGKRQLGEMELSEFVLASLIADLAAHPLQDVGIPMINGLIPIAVLFCCEVIIAGATMRSLRLRAILFGKPSILISRGRIVQSEMRKNRFTADELMQELRSRSIKDISKVEYAVLETDGSLSIMLYPSEQPASASLLKLDAGKSGYCYIVINEGQVLAQNLRLLGKDLRWLEKALRCRGIKNARDVFLMTLNEEGEIYLAPKEALP